MFKKVLKTVALASLLTGVTHAAEIEVKIINNTGASTLTPLLISAHANETSLFKVGEAASESLQTMAEGGNIAGLITNLSEVSADIVENPADGLLFAGENTTAQLKTNAGNDVLSIVAMILPTNDGFVALKNWKIPTEAGTYTVKLNAYDAGTEANDEIINGGGEPNTPGIPADPSGNAGENATGYEAEVEGFVHIHRGVLGDTDLEGGASDLDATKHRWLNPVATAIITVK